LKNYQTTQNKEEFVMTKSVPDFASVGRFWYNSKEKFV